MRPRLTLAAALAALLVPAAPALAGDPTMPLSQVRAGMQCTGYSVVRGTDVASFRVEVLDVVDGDPTADGPRILVQASGPAVDATGIGPGFSGSPILCPDAAGVARNIGAISESIGEYGGKVVLATPIEAILGTPVDPPRGASAPGARAAAAERRLAREGARPLAAPLTVSGLSAGLARGLEAAGRRLGRPVTTAPAGPLGSFPVQRLRPGAAVAVGYSNGDLKIGAIGTVSYTDGASVWAFGHPFENAGARALLLQDAYVYRVIANPDAADTGGSYKFASAGHDVGTLTSDGASAVAGRVGALPRTIPIRVAGRDRDTGRRTVVHVRAADETAVDTPTGFSPLATVAPLAVAQAGIAPLRSAPGRLSGRLCLRIAFRGVRTPARFCNRYASTTIADGQDLVGGNGVAIAAALDASDAFGIVDGYAGRPLRIERVSARVDLRRGEQAAELVRVRAPRRARPGQRVRLRVTLQRLRGATVARRYRVRIPRDARPGRRRLVLRGADGPAGGADGLFDDVLAVGGGGGTRSLRRPGDFVAAIRTLARFDGATAKLGRQRFRAFRDDRLLITGRAAATLRVRR